MRTPLEKVQCLVNTVDIILKCLKEGIKHNQKINEIETDDLLPQISYIICDSYPHTQNLCSDLSYIYDYHFENISVSDMGYIMTNIEIALSWLKTQGEMKQGSSLTKRNSQIPPPLEYNKSNYNLPLLDIPDFEVSPASSHEASPLRKTYSSHVEKKQRMSWSNVTRKNPVRIAKFASYSRLLSENNIKT